MMGKQDAINPHLQDCVVYLSITSEEFLKLCRATFRPEHMPTVYGQFILRLCFAYWDQFRTAPSDHFHDELVRQIKTLPEEDRGQLSAYVRRIQSMRVPNFQYVISRLSDYIRRREMELAAVDFAEMIARGEIDEAQDLMLNALKSGIHQVDVGIDYLRAQMPRRARPDYNQALMTTGISELDKIVKGYRRKQFIVFLGAPKGMKTWCLCHLARTALLHGLNVVHISHEMDDEEMETRYDQMIGSMVNGESKEVKFTFFDRKTGEMDRTTEVRPSVNDWKAAMTARQKIRRFGGRLFIKKYPMGTATMRDVDRYLHYLELTEGVAADVIINDYADIMAPLDARADYRHQINQTYVYHKRIADERNALMVTVSQCKADAIGRSRMTRKDFAEDIRKIANVDVGFGIAQSEEDEAEGLALLHVLASRTSMSGSVLIGPALEMGQFAVWSAPINARPTEGDITH